MELLGIMLLCLCTCAVFAGAWAVASCFYPGRPWTRLIATWLLGATTITLLGQLLGVFSVLRPVPLAVPATAAGVVAVLATRRRRAASRERWAPLRWPLSTGWAVAILAMAVGVLVTCLVTSTANDDALVYHYPMVAGWLQAASLVKPSGTIIGYFTWFYPSNTEVLHAWTVVFTHRDLVPNVVGFLTYAVTFAAIVGLVRDAGCLTGRPRLVAAAPVVALAWCTLPLFMLASIGTAGVDAGVTGYFLLAVMFGLRWWLGPARGGRPTSDLILAGLAAGLSLGSKYSAVPLVAFLAAAFVALVLVRGYRGGPHALGRAAGAAVAGLAAMAAPSGFWFVRNAVLVGNPIYPGRLPGLPDANAVAGLGSSYKLLAHRVVDVLASANVWLVATFLLATGVAGVYIVANIVPNIVTLWRGRKVAGMPSEAAAPVAPRVPALVGAASGSVTRESPPLPGPTGPTGPTGGASPPRPLSRDVSNALLFVYGLLPLALGVLWALTPETAFGPAKEPYLFPLNLRYGMPGFALILAGAALCTYLRKPDARGWWLRIVVACSLAHVVAAVVTNSPNIPSAWTFSAGVLAGGGVVVLAWLARRLPRGVRRPALAAYVCIAVAGAFAAGTWILHPSRSYALGLDLVDVAAPIADSRSPVCVAYSTSVKRSYPLYGERLQNRVLLAGREAAPGTYGRFTRPKQLVRFLQDNRCSYFVTKDDSLDGPHGTSDNDLRLINSLLARHADPLFRAGVMAMYDRFERTPEYAWAAGMPATFEPVRQSGAYVLYRFHDDE